VDERPSAEAIVCGERRITYGALWERIARAAGALDALGVGPQDRVVLVLPGGADYATACYAALALGAVVVPLSPDAAPAEAIRWIAHCDARAAVVAARHPLRAAISQAGLRTVTPDAADRGRPLPPDALAAPDPETPAAILYTSGTTSHPKGVTLSHANLGANALAIVESLGIAPGDRTLLPLPLHHAYGSSVLHSHLAAGGTVVVERGLMYPQKVVERMREERVTAFAGVPWMYRVLLDRTRLLGMRREMDALRYVTQAGAPMPWRDVQRLRRGLPGVGFVPMYGQTEATARLSYLPPSELDARPGSVGRPVPGVRLEVRRADGTRAPAGEEGEVVAAGPGVMIGYWNDPAATREVIAEEPDGRWLRTGDVGCLDADGYLYLRGRRADLIKTGGHRVSPFEIEEVLLQSDAIDEAAAFGVPDDAMGERVEAAAVLKPGRSISEMELLACCRDRLSRYKVPARVHLVRSLPHTASGKLRRRALAGLFAGEVAT
jgi:acyl-CoA synthetase (AMP-forming)/AMP-acid ligase II